MSNATYDTATLPRKPNQLFNDNKLRLGTFSSNLVTCQTLAPEAWRPTWEDVLDAAKAADDAGFEAIVPVGRWKGYMEGNADHRSHDSFDAFSFAAALGQATKHATIFSTVHAALTHPIMMAKIGTSIDHISQGRWALNVVGGWNRAEFEMFGVDMRDHQARYDYLEEWLNVVRTLWTADEEINWNSANFNLKGALCRPKPRQSPTPPIMNAGFSPAGRRFTARNSDIGFIMITGGGVADWRKQVDDLKSLGRESGRDLKVWTAAHIVQAPTRQEARDYIDKYLPQHADLACINPFMETLAHETGLGMTHPAMVEQRRMIEIGSGWTIPGPPEFIADELQAMVEAGVDGVLLGWTDFTSGIQQFRRDVMPILEKRGLRHPHAV